MEPCYISKTIVSVQIAVCIFTVMLSASCATSQKNVSDKKSSQEISQLYLELGTSALMRGEYSQAVEDLRKAIVANKANAVAHNHLGLAYYSLGRKEMAKEEIETAIDYDSNYSDAYINLGGFALDSHDRQSAKRYFRRALENLEYKLRHRALTSLAQVALQESKPEEARQLLYQSLQVNPDYCLSHFLLGTLFTRDGNHKRAAEEFSKSIAKICSGELEGHYQLGLSYSRLRQYDKARQEFIFLVEQYPQSIQAQHAGEQLRNLP